MAVTYMLTDKPGNIDMVKFDFDDKECTMTWSEGLETNTIILGLDVTGSMGYLAEEIAKTALNEIILIK